MFSSLKILRSGWPIFGSKSFVSWFLEHPSGVDCTLTSRGLCLSAAFGTAYSGPSAFVVHLLCSSALLFMAANPAPTFANMLVADSDFVMPATDKDVRAALDSFGADYKRTRGYATTRSVRSCSLAWHCCIPTTSILSRSWER